MSWIERISVGVTNTASACIVDTYIRQGFLYAIRYSTASSSGFSGGATVIISAIGAASGVASAPQHNILRISPASNAAIYFPRIENQTSAGATMGGGANMYPIVNENLRIEVQSGGITARGLFEFYLAGNQ